ncbi:diguanylate cyclase [Cupriavidus sp. NPDC089707]|uniref:GGDEF domain-containing protein n=1 Tax=Cupriavidus sp. NPDC089707 TaxID=3363963 RepID=UPI0038224EF9
MSKNFSLPQWQLTKWLLDSGRPISPDIERDLVASLFGTLSIFIGGVTNTLLVALLITWHVQRQEFFVWLALEVLVCAARIGILISARRRARMARSTHTDLHVILSLVWAFSVGLGTYLSITSGDWLAAALACLSSAAMVGGICFRNFGAPRMTGVMILLALGPCCLGAMVAQEPLFLLTLIQLPVYVVSMTSASFRMNAMVVATMQSERDNAHRARHDSLTGLLNRATLLAEIEMAISRARSGTARPSLLYLDLDGFKRINDVYGHGCGDELLEQVAARMREAVPKECRISRIGGDEFVILMNDHDKDGAQALARRLLIEIAAPYLLANGEEVVIGVSIGIAQVPSTVQSADAALNIADRALYVAKASGKSRFHVAEII